MAVVSDRDQLCHQCAQIPPISEIVLGSYEVWDSLQQMRESAQNGCPSCTFFYRHCFKPGIHSPRSKDHMVGDPRTWGPYMLRWNGHFPWETTLIEETPSIAVICDKHLSIETYQQGYYDVDEASYLLFADPHEPLAKTVWARDVSLDPRSEIVFQRINRWIEECCQKHAACKYEETPVLPRFVVEIGPSEEISGQARPFLRLIENDGSQRATYITLNIVWGVRAQPVQLSQSNFEDSKNSIDYSLLPPTIQDFIYVAQQLEVKYIWVDTLCIVQDNEEIKKHEIVQMNVIFGKSFLTVQAGNVHSVHESFLRQRGPPEHPSLKLRFDDSSHILLRADGPVPTPDTSSPANRRGWIFEESVLPTRLLIYGTHQIVFACRRGSRREDGSLQHPRSTFYPSFLQPQPWSAGGLGETFGRGRRDPDKRLDFLKCWYSALSWTYTARVFTLSQDKLRAIHGVVARLQDKIGGRFIAGLWESDMPWGLLWSSSSHITQGHRMYLEDSPMTLTVGCQAPSWSWAAVDGRTATRFDDRFRRHSEPIASVNTGSIHVDDLGEISGGVLEIAGPFLYAELVHPDEDLFKRLQPIAFGKGLGTRGILSILVWAKPSVDPGYQDPTFLGMANIDVKEEQLKGVWCILLTRQMGLMLECVDSYTKKFRRVGLFTLCVDDWLPSLNEKLLAGIVVV